MKEKIKEKNHTSAQDFQYFKKRCLYWQEQLGLGQWEIYFSHIDLIDKRAISSWQIGARKATITLSVDWGEDKEINPINDEQLNRSALHEMLHILLAGLESYCDFYASWLIEREEHVIINHLLHAILKKIDQK